MSLSLAAWQEEIGQELKNGILEFWMTHAVDADKGGFHGEIAEDGTPNPAAHRSLVLNTRLLWTFASAFRTKHDKRYLELAERAYRYLTEKFTDSEHGGMYWMVDAFGVPVDEKKQVYGQAFALYALSEYVRATGSREALELAVGIFRQMERHAFDPVHGGYFEALARNWERFEDYSLSHHGVKADKTMNNHLHIMEAYTNLYRVWPEDELKQKLAAVIELTLDRIVNKANGHFHLFFDDAWCVQSAHISYGHDIEGSWLITEAADVLGEAELFGRAKAVAIQMADATLKEGVDEDGGLWNEGTPEGLIDRNKDWWPQAEAMVGFYNAYQLTGEDRYREAALHSWRFIRAFLVDKQYGEWYWSVTENGEPLSKVKANPWKCPYHNGRACLEMLERLEHEAREHATAP
ncbi:AGE family epimerase/isomerase [Paenibacillus xanthanilyticus]|uniref:Cellobiose 2-epimerase n=1 Tax=Paenibacillus xanthanilyticus TaxID=1783531 RepID=A0ABV8K7K3_9BACL